MLPTVEAGGAGAPAPSSWLQPLRSSSFCFLQVSACIAERPSSSRFTWLTAAVITSSFTSGWRPPPAPPSVYDARRRSRRRCRRLRADHQHWQQQQQQQEEEEEEEQSTGSSSGSDEATPCDPDDGRAATSPT